MYQTKQAHSQLLVTSYSQQGNKPMMFVTFGNVWIGPSAVTIVISFISASKINVDVPAYSFFQHALFNVRGCKVCYTVFSWTRVRATNLYILYFFSNMQENYTSLY
jgi:hypothetical protein